MCQEKSVQSAPRRKRNIILTVLLTVFALIFIGIFTLIFMLAEQHPVQAEKTTDKQISRAMGSVSGKVFRAIRQAAKDKQPLCTITLTEEEVNALTALTMRFVRSKQKPGEPEVTAYWQKGVCYAGVSKKFAGLYWNVRVAAVPVWQEQKLTLNIISGKAGSLSLPEKRLEEIANIELQKRIDSNKKLRRILPLLYQAQFSADGSLTLTVPVKAAYRMLSLLF